MVAIGAMAVAIAAIIFMLRSDRPVAVAAAASDDEWED